MAHWHYYDESGAKIGPLSVADLKFSAQQGLITRSTVVENEAGRTAVAGKVHGLTFPETPIPDVQESEASIDTIEDSNRVKSPVPITQFTLYCPSCNRKLNAKDKHAGRTLKCPACQAPVTIPAIATLLENAQKISQLPIKAASVPPIQQSAKNPLTMVVAATVPVAPSSQERKTEDHKSEFQPLDEYANIYKQRHAENVSNFFEKLFAKSGVNQDENRITVEQINKLQGELDVENKSLRKAYFQQGWLIFAIVMCVASILGGFFVIGNPDVMDDWGYSHQVIITISVLAIILAVLGTATAIWAIVKKTAPRIKELKSAIAHLEERRNALVAVGFEQMQPLNNLFERFMSSRLMEKTYPLIKLDDYFDIKRYDCLSSKYGLWSNSDVDSSTLFVQSGEINGNPFCFFTNLNHHLGTETYTGYLTVTWMEVEEYAGKDGKSFRTIQKSERLSASVTKPCPRYHTEIILVYGNEAAPNLSFSREDTDAEHWDEKRTEREANKKIKKINAQMRKAVSQGKTFTSMGNEFDALFGATDRDNEVEFRVLFTPLAQREMLKLIKDKTVSWGDDFNFRKAKMLNLIGSDHLTGYDMSGNPANYRHYDIDTIRKNFNDYNNEYFRAIYFAFAPLLAIPLYQQHKPHEFIYKDVYQQRFSCHAHEYAVNKMDISQFAPPKSSTQNILKTELLAGGDRGDTVNVTAYGYETANRRDHVNVYSYGTKQTHSVAVDWVEYLPVQKTTNRTITEQDVR